MSITIERISYGHYDASMGGIGFCWTSDVTTISSRTSAPIRVTDTTSTMTISHGSDGEATYDVSEDVPADCRDHEAIVAFWAKKLAQRDAERDVTCEGVAVSAPGFTQHTFDMALIRARRDRFQTRPQPRTGECLIPSARTGETYTVSRHECTCKGHEGHGYCKHRAWAIFLADVACIDPAAVPTIAGMTGEPAQDLAAA